MINDGEVPGTYVLHAGLIHCGRGVNALTALPARLPQLYRRTAMWLHPDVFWIGVLHAKRKGK